ANMSPIARTSRALAGCGLLTWVIALARGSEPAVSPAEQVRTVPIERCLTCHAGEQPKGGLDLTRRTSALKGGKAGPAVVPVEPEESLLLEKVEAREMP